VIFLLMGMAVSTYGPLLEHLTRRFGVSLPVAGATISVHFAGAVPGVFLAMWAVRRLPARAIVVAASAVASLGLAAVAIAFAWPMFLAAVFVLGLGFGALVLSLNQLVAFSAGRRRAALLNALNAAYSAGAVAGPLLVAALAREHFSLLYAGGALVWLAVIPGALGIAGRLPVDAAASRRPGVLVGVFICAFILYVAIETGTGGWMTSHLESLGVASDNAATLTSAFFLAIVTGRLLITLVPPVVPESTVVLASAVAATVALAAAAAGVGLPWAYVAAGLAMAPIFPTGVVWLARLRPTDSTATAWLFPATSVGGVVGPAAIGIVIANAGVRWRRRSSSRLDDERSQVVAREKESALHQLERALELSVLVLDRNHPVVVDGVERGHEPVPAHLAKPGQARHLPSHPERQHAVLVEAVAVDLHVLGVDVEDPGGEVAHSARVVDELPDQVRGVEVQAEVFVRDDLEQLSPQRRRVGEVAAAGPLVVGEDHRAVLDGDLHAPLARKAHQRRPHALEVLEVAGDVALLISADEGADDLNLEALRRLDDATQVRVGGLACVLVGVEVVRVVRERGDLEVVAAEQPAHGARVEVLDVDVADAGVPAALSSARRPACDLERLESVVVRPARDLLEGQVGKSRGQEAELHRATLTSRATSAQR
jgi:FHS family glucose/mannose:H+ symporter-like MFS transporter